MAVKGASRILLGKLGDASGPISLRQTSRAKDLAGKDTLEVWQMEEMEGLVNTMPWILGGLVLVIALAALRRPLKWACKVLLRSTLGLGVLFAFSKIGGLLGLSLGVNVINALVIGLLGAPGFGLLLLINWALTV